MAVCLPSPRVEVKFIPYQKYISPFTLVKNKQLFSDRADRWRQVESTLCCQSMGVIIPRTAGGSRKQPRMTYRPGRRPRRRSCLTTPQSCEAAQERWRRQGGDRNSMGEISAGCEMVLLQQLWRSMPKDTVVFPSAHLEMIRAQWRTEIYGWS